MPKPIGTMNKEERGQMLVDGRRTVPGGRSGGQRGGQKQLTSGQGEEEAAAPAAAVAPPPGADDGPKYASLAGE
jgi:pre-mRNA-splicing factor RBM22/SLT11